MDFPIKNGDFPLLFVSSPEGRSWTATVPPCAHLIHLDLSGARFPHLGAWSATSASRPRSSRHCQARPRESGSLLVGGLLWKVGGDGMA